MKTKAIAMVGALVLGVTFMASQVDAWGGYYYRYDHRYPFVKKVNRVNTYLIKSSVWVDRNDSDAIVFGAKRFTGTPTAGHFSSIVYKRVKGSNYVSVYPSNGSAYSLNLGGYSSNEGKQEIQAYREAEGIAMSISPSRPSSYQSVTRSTSSAATPSSPSLETISVTKNYNINIFSGQEIEPGKPAFKTKADNGHNIEFAIDDNEILHLYDVKDKKKKKDELSFIPNAARLPGTKSMLRYEVKKVYIDNPHKEFFIVNARGNHETVGWWMVGLHRGKWATYMTSSNFNMMGADSTRIRLYHEKSGKLYPYNSHLFFTSQTYSPQKGVQHKEDFAVRAYWDREARWIGLEYIPLKDFDTYITRS